MVPLPGESAEEMFRVTGWQPESRDDSSTRAIFYHDVPRRACRGGDVPRPPSVGHARREPWPLAAWPDIPTRFIVCRNDRFFPARWLRGVVRDRLGIAPDEIDSGHCPALSRPVELAHLLEGYVSSIDETAN